MKSPPCRVIRGAERSLRSLGLPLGLRLQFQGTLTMNVIEGERTVVQQLLPRPTHPTHPPSLLRSIADWKLRCLWCFEPRFFEFVWCLGPNTSKNPVLHVYQVTPVPQCFIPVYQLSHLPQWQWGNECLWPSRPAKYRSCCSGGMPSFSQICFLTLATKSPASTSKTGRFPV